MPFCFAYDFDYFNQSCNEKMKDNTGNYSDWIVANPFNNTSTNNFINASKSNESHIQGFIIIAD